MIRSIWTLDTHCLIFTCKIPANLPLEARQINVTALIVVSAAPGASALQHSPAVPEARSLRGLRRDAEGSHMAETVRAAHALLIGFVIVRSDVRIHALERCYIGVNAYECIGVYA